MPIPSYIGKYFWDINPKTASPKKHPEYYIKRILELGDRKAFNWAKLVFGKERIKRTVKMAKISSRARNYWGSIINV